MTDLARYSGYTSNNERIAYFICSDDSGPAFVVVNSRFDFEFGEQRRVTWRVDNEPPVDGVWDQFGGNAGGAIG